MKLLQHIFSKLDKNESSYSFGLFRILFHAHWLWLLVDIYPIRDLLFDSVSPWQRVDIPMDMLIFFSAFFSFLMMIGMLTKYVSVVNYILFVIITFSNINFHTASFYDDLLKIGSLGCIFLPVARSFSVDAMLSKNTNQQTWKLNYTLLLFISLGLLYFGSAITKLYSPIWQKGIGLWMPMAVPSNNITDFSIYIADHILFLKLLSGIVIIWEFTFIFCVFFPSTYLVISIFGILFHVGIAALFPFPKISLGPLMFYTLLIPEKFWLKIKSIVPIFKNHLPAQQPSPSVLTYTQRKQLFISFAVFLLIMQLFVSGYKFYYKGYEKEKQFKRLSKQSKEGYRFSLKPSKAIRTFWGINGRGLFLDQSFTGTKNTYAIVYKNKLGNWDWLPYFNYRGMPGEYNQNMAWAKNTFQLISLPANGFNENGLKLFTAFWARKNNLSLDSLHFRVLFKETTYPTEYEPKCRQKLEHQPWKTHGYITWYKEQFSYIQLDTNWLRK